MQLAAEWDQRVNLWLEELKNQVFIRLGEVRFEGWVTKERLSYEEALKGDFAPMPRGTKWGAKWEYGWFKAELTLPKEAQGCRIFLHPEVGGEMLLWVNGKIAGSKDLKHTGITLTKNAALGQRFFIVAESYAGHGPRLEKGGPCPPEQTAVPEPPAFQAEVGDCNFGIWNEAAYQLLLDAYTLHQLYQGLDPKSLRAMKIRQGLMEFTKIADFELEPEERNQTFIRAREVLKPLLSCKNGSTAPVFTIIGQSHLDLAWMWPWEETRRKCARTISNQIALSDEYEDYKFFLCEPPIMENLKENYPELYGRLKKKVEEGRFIPEGGMYVESDTNLVSGESLVRQCIYGREWFRREMGTESLLVWLPDCFGFNGQLPQIMKGCGFCYFTTQKLSRALKGCDVFPYNTFWWEGIDGTRILTNFYKKNNARIDPLELINRWNHDRVQEENMETFLYPFGYGDGGGGATRDMVEIAGRLKDLEGAPRTRMESPVKFFERLKEQGNDWEVYRGELYLAWHRGTYTSQARMKKENRRTEEALREAELWNAVGAFTGKADKEAEHLKALWKTLLFNQFHDIIPGTSITRVYEEAYRDLEQVRKAAGKLCQKAQEGLLRGEEEGITVFNSLPRMREELVELSESMGASFMQNGRRLPIQRNGKKLLVPVKVPACGYASLMPEQGREEEKQPFFQEGCRIFKNEEGFVLENSLIRALINNRGEVLRLEELKSGIQYGSGALNRLHLYQDVNVDYDAWELSSFYQELEIGLNETAEAVIAEEGPLEAALEVKRMIGASPMVQRICLRYNSARLDFITRIDWRETHRLLKTAFPVNIRAEEAIEEIPFGCIRRPTHRNRRYDADRFEVCNYRYTALSEPGRTAAVLNDCKYGISVNGNSMELTLLKSPVWPDMYADKGIQEFTYSFYVENKDFADSGVVWEAMALNYKLAPSLRGAGEKEYLRLSADDVMLEAAKLAEDGSGDMILRLYEAVGRHTLCTLSAAFPMSRALETTMEEQEGRALGLKQKEGRWEILLEFAPFEIKTIRLIP